MSKKDATAAAVDDVELFIKLLSDPRWVAHAKAVGKKLVEAQREAEGLNLEEPPHKEYL